MSNPATPTRQDASQTMDEVPIGDLTPEEYHLMTQVTQLPTQDQVWLIQNWWASLPGPNPTNDNYLNSLSCDLKVIMSSANTCKYKHLPLYLKQTLKIKVFPMTVEAIQNFLLALHLSNPEFEFPPFDLCTPQSQDPIPFPEFRLDDEFKDCTLDIMEPPATVSTTHQLTLPQHQVKPVGPQPPDQANYTTFMQNLDAVVKPTTQVSLTHPNLQPPTTQPIATWHKLPNGLFWEPASNTFMNAKGMSLKDSRFTYQPKNDKPLTWTPDLQLTTHQPHNHSLSTKHYKQFQVYQTLLQQIHLELDLPPDFQYTISYLPNSNKPQGIAGISSAILTMETYLKEYIIADRYATLQTGQQNKVPALELAHNLRTELPHIWHLPLDTLVTKTDQQVKLKGVTARLSTPSHQHPNRPNSNTNPHYNPPATSTLDKDTTKALANIPSNTINPRGTFPIKQPPLGHPYQGKHYDPHFVHPNQKAKNGLKP